MFELALGALGMEVILANPEPFNKPACLCAPALPPRSILLLSGTNDGATKDVDVEVNEDVEEEVGMQV